MGVYYLIGHTAKEAGVCPGTVRKYCQMGLLTPLFDSAGRRLFTDHDIHQIRQIYLDNMARRPLAEGGRR